MAKYPNSEYPMGGKSMKVMNNPETQNLQSPKAANLVQMSLPKEMYTDRSNLRKVIPPTKERESMQAGNSSEIPQPQ
jgi:hypothetical protein